MFEDVEAYFGDDCVRCIISLFRSSLERCCEGMIISGLQKRRTVIEVLLVGIRDERYPWGGDNMGQGSGDGSCDRVSLLGGYSSL